MKVLAGISLAVLIGLAGPAAWAGSGGHGRPVLAMQPHTSVAPMGREASRQRPRFGGFGALGSSGAYTTLLSGTFESGPTPEDETGAIFPPPLPYGGYAYYLVPQPAPHHCVRSLLIHLTHPLPVKNLPRVIYGEPFDCAG